MDALNRTRSDLVAGFDVVDARVSDASKLSKMAYAWTMPAEPDQENNLSGGCRIVACARDIE